MGCRQEEAYPKEYVFTHLRMKRRMDAAMECKAIMLGNKFHRQLFVVGDIQGHSSFFGCLLNLYITRNIP